MIVTKKASKNQQKGACMVAIERARVKQQNNEMIEHGNESVKNVNHVLRLMVNNKNSSNSNGMNTRLFPFDL